MINIRGKRVWGGKRNPEKGQYTHMSNGMGRLNASPFLLKFKWITESGPASGHFTENDKRELLTGEMDNAVFTLTRKETDGNVTCKKACGKLLKEHLFCKGNAALFHLILGREFLLAVVKSKLLFKDWAGASCTPKVAAYYHVDSVIKS